MHGNRVAGSSRRTWLQWTAAGLLAVACGCADEAPQYGIERSVPFPGGRRQVWAVAPVLNLSGQKEVDPILQADLVYQQLQQVDGLTVLPVNRVAELYAGLRLKDGVQSEKEALAICDLLHCDGLVVPTVTVYDPYNPPKLGASLQLFLKPEATARTVGAVLNPHDMERSGTATTITPRKPPTGSLVQVVGMYDAANGSVRAAVFRYAEGRNDPQGPFGAREYFMSMDRYCGFVYHVLIIDLLNSPGFRRMRGLSGGPGWVLGDTQPHGHEARNERNFNGAGRADAQELVR